MYHPLLCLFMVPRVFKSENSPKMAIFDLECAIFDQKWNPRLLKIFSSERQQKTVPVLIVSSTSMLIFGTCGLQKWKLSENGYFWPKMCHFWIKMKSETFKNICIWTAAKSCASTNSIIHFYAYIWYLRSSKVKIVQKRLFLTWNGPFLTKNEIQDFQKYCYLNGNDKLCQYP